MLLDIYAESETYLMENAEILSAEAIDMLITEAAGTVKQKIDDKKKDVQAAVNNFATKANDKRKDAQATISNIAAKANARKKSIWEKITALLKTLGRVIAGFFRQVLKRLTDIRGIKIAFLDKEAATLLGHVDKLKIAKLALPQSAAISPKGVELVKGIFGNEQQNIQMLNDSLRKYLDPAAFKALKENEAWLAPQLEIKTAKTVSEIDNLMEEMQLVISKICNLKDGSRAALNITKALNSLSAKIRDMSSDTRSIQFDVKTFSDKSKLISTATTKMNDSLDELAKRFDMDDQDKTSNYGKIFTALSGSIAELRKATASVMNSVKIIVDKTNAAVDFQQKVHVQVKGAIKNQ